jgi:hypothetical protein
MQVPAGSRIDGALIDRCAVSSPAEWKLPGAGLNPLPEYTEGNDKIAAGERTP